MTVRIFTSLLFVVFLAFVLSGCQDDEGTIPPPKEPETAGKDTIPVVIVGDAKATYDLQGYAQKGPFINGTAITVSELDSTLAATGKNFTTQITDNKGTFAIKNIELQSEYVQLMANGFYFDEAQGEKSTAQLTLFALANLADTSNTVNVNLLSHLEKDRVRYLMQDENKSFATAKKQAQKEVLAIFGIEKEGIAASENLDITQEGDDNAILLAISVILQGYDGNVGNLSELLANISGDLEKDGLLNDSTSGSSLINNTVYLDLATIRKNVIDRYQELGHAIVVGDFEKYVQQFVASTKFTITRRIEYPDRGFYGENVLAGDKNVYQAGQYSLAADLPVGSGLKVVVRSMPNSEQYGWSYALSSENNYQVAIDWSNGALLTLQTIDSGKKCDLQFFLSSNGLPVTIELYESGATTPTKIKQITVTQ